jgi:hypothetical protein
MLASIEGLASADALGEHPFGSRYWFLTLDRRLAACARRNVDAGIGSVCMLAEEWVHYVAPFVGPNISQHESADVFAKLLSSRFFLSLGDSLTLADLQPFTAPKVNELVADLSADEAARAVAEAHFKAVAAPAAQASDQERLGRLVDLVEKRLEAKRRAGELIPASELEEIREAHEAEEQTRRAALAGKDEVIAALRRDLAIERTYRDTSLRHWRERLGRQLGRARVPLKAWLRAHRRRAAFLAAAAICCVALLALGRGSVVAWVLSAIVAVIAFLSVEPRTLRRNLNAWLGRRER